MSENIWFLKRCGLFERLTPEEIQRLENRAVERTFPPKAIIYFPTDAGESVMVLIRGRVKIKDINPDGKETILAFIDEGEIFGELAILDREPRNEFAEAIEESEVLAIPRENLLAVMEQRPDLALHVTKLVGLRRRRIENRLRNILFRSNRERLVHLLLELLESHGQQAGDSWEIGLRLSQQDLASLIGVTRETVTLFLARLQLDRLIQVRRKRITILDRERLLAEAGGATPAAHEATTPPPRRRARRL